MNNLSAVSTGENISHDIIPLWKIDITINACFIFRTSPLSCLNTYSIMIQINLTMAIMEAMKLEIVTSNQGQENQAYRTTINLLENQVEHQLGESDASLEKFHFSQVETAREMMLQNVASLQEIFTLLQENVDRL